MQKATAKTIEPNYAAACNWWSDLPNIWTPVGWQDHLFRFNVLWDGTIVAQTQEIWWGPPDCTEAVIGHTNRRTEAWKNQGVLLFCSPLRACSGGDSWRGDDNTHMQGWKACPTPVLWTERAHDGILYRQEIFAHVPGGQALRRGDEPLFAWIRLSLADMIDALPLENEVAFGLGIQGDHLTANMSYRNNIVLRGEKAIYQRPLKIAGRSPGAVRIMEPDGRVRLGVVPGAQCKLRFTTSNPNDTAAHLHIEGIKVKKGAQVDVLLPMVPVDRKVFERELALGFDGALREADRFWAPLASTGATIQVPELPVTQAIQHSVRLSRLLTEKNPATGKYCKFNGSLVYINLWSTPVAMELIMLNDMLGEHDFVARYLEIFKDEQGTVIPPGSCYQQHPGYFSTPALYKAHDWLSDNGAILYIFSMHGLLSGDADYIAQFTDAIVKSCDWIKTYRALKGHGGYEGVLPAAVATDKLTRIQAVWSDGWNYKGLCAAVRLLKRIGHPRAAEFEQEARDYKAAFGKALRDKCRNMPVWKDAQGKSHVIVPTALSGDQREETRHPFYLDGGPLVLVFTGLIDASDPLMRGTALWFREGPPRRFARPDGCAFEGQVPYLEHEMSSCEPCYSWNVFHSWQLGDREKFLEGMYSLFAGGLSRKTFISCETRGGITGNVFAAPLAIYLARLAVIDDELVDGELHLLRMMPLAWLKSDQLAFFENMPTEFGPVTLTAKLSPDGKTLAVAFKPKFRQPPCRVVLHVPPVSGLRAVTVNGTTFGTLKNEIILEPVRKPGSRGRSPSRV